MKKTLLLFVYTLAIVGFSFAADEEGEKKHSHEDGGHHATILVPEDLTDLWSHINAYSKVVSNAAKEGDVETLHKQQNNLNALIGALEASSESLTDDKRNRIEGMIKNAQRALGQLHGVTDKKDTAAMQKTVKGLTGVILILKAQYPKEVTAGMAEVKDDLGPHQGMLAVITDVKDKPVGHLELKLHDDKGDLELWLAGDAAITKPLDIPASSKIMVSFDDAKEDSATLTVRNTDKNEDEDGTPNMRDGKTNYFIFPGDSGASADWLMGVEFKSKVRVSFTTADGELTTGTFLLIPHTHGDGHDH